MFNHIGRARNDFHEKQKIIVGIFKMSTALPGSHNEGLWNIVHRGGT